MRILLAVALLGAAPPLDMRTINDDYPPARYQGNATVTIRFVDDVNGRGACGIPAPGYTFLGCTRQDNTILMPNPCRVRGEQFAKIMCHEAGHVQGWNGTHDN